MNERGWGVVTAVYLALMALWLGLWWFTADRFWWLVMVNRVERKRWQMLLTAAPT